MPRKRRSREEDSWVRWHDYWPVERVTRETQFHAYILCSIIGVRYGRVMPSSATAHPVLGPILREYLSFAFPDKSDGRIRRVLDVMRHKSGAAVKKETRTAFPSLFPRNRKALSLRVPEELKDIDVNFDLAFIEALRSQVKAYKKEIAMNEETEVLGDEPQAEVVPAAEAAKPTKSATKVNFYVPAGLDASTLTLDNYRELTKKRYRMTKDQAARKLTREAAFEESKALAVQLGDK